MKRLSFLDCPHARVQQFTENCLDCGWNIYTTTDEYLDYLKKQVQEKKMMDQRKAKIDDIRELEKLLGIGE